MARMQTIVAAAALFAAYANAQACSCSRLSVDYTSDAIPDATSAATVDISLNETTWDVVFRVEGVKSISNGHVIASAVNTRQNVSTAFAGLTTSSDLSGIWDAQATNCDLSAIDTPHADLKITTEYDAATCLKNYEMRYSLLDSSKQDTTHCTLTDDGTDIKVNCSIVLSSVRAYDATEAWAFTAQEAAFAADISLGKRLNNEVADLLYATLAKCSVKNGPLYVVDCRIPGSWTFHNTFTISQEPAGWIDQNTCAQNIVGSGATAATFIRCSLNSSAPIATVATAKANISATKDKAAGEGNGSGSDVMTFDVEYIIPRRVEYSTSASLANIIKGLAMTDGKYYYGTADKATLEIDTVDMNRLVMTQLEIFNSATPKQVYKLMTDADGTADPVWKQTTTKVDNKFVVDFYPAAMRNDAAFYRNGPHGINVSFVFTAARRQNDGGYATVTGLNVQGTEESDSSASGASASAASGTALMAGVAVGAAVLAVGLIGAAVVVVMRRRNAEAAKEQL